MVEGGRYNKTKPGGCSLTYQAGTKFGPYEIIELIGAGGMGEVYEALDPRLQRHVAIKILPQNVSADADRLKRFEQEARAVGSLSHPNVLAVYDVGQYNGCPFLVSELLHGDTLRSKLKGTPLPVKKTVEYAIQIAYGLTAAHEKGIIHRDLKPENIIVNRAGQVKILDFGLAKLLNSDTSVETPAHVTTPVTESGRVLGTVGYIAPEQIVGRPCDQRVDIFAFGVILYECLTGHRPFHRPTTVESLNAILKEEPPEPSKINPDVSPALDRIVKHSLEKSPEQRFQTALDVAFSLEALTNAPPSGSSGAAVTFDRRKKIWPALSLVALFLFLFATIWHFRFDHEESGQTYRFSIEPPAAASFRGMVEMALSPDGSRLAFAAPDAAGKRHIWVREMNAPDSQILTETASGDEGMPFWSPDGKDLGYFADGKLWRINLKSRLPIMICDAASGRGGSWSKNGMIVFAPTKSSPIYKVPAAGGTAIPTTVFDNKTDYSHRAPYFLPDQKHFLYLDWSATESTKKRGICIGSLDSQPCKFLLASDANAAYSPSGHLIFVNEKNLMVQQFDEKSLALTGDPMTLVPQRLSRENRIASFAISNNGVLIYQPEVPVLSEITWLDSAGRTTGTVGEPRYFQEVHLSPNGLKIAVVVFQVEDFSQDIWIYDSDGKQKNRFTFISGGYYSPVWSPDNDAIVYGWEKSGVSDLYVKRLFETDSRLELQSLLYKFPLQWSNDGRYILFEVTAPKTNRDIWAYDTAQRKAFPVVESPFQDRYGKLSPDGSKIAFTSDQSGRQEVYVSSFPSGKSDQFQVSQAGGLYPEWGKDGASLYYISVSRQMVKADLTSRIETQMFPIPSTIVRAEESAYQYDALNDKFLFRVPTNAVAPALKVILNWPAELH